MSYPKNIAPFVDGVSTAHLPLQTTYGYTGSLATKADFALWHQACRLAYDAQPHWVYWHFDADGVLLYVGSTSDLRRRTTQHRYSPWWDEVARIASTRFETRTKARAVEKAAIQAGRPLHNIKHNEAAA